MGELADVVHQRGPSQAVSICLGALELLTEEVGEDPHPLRVPPGAPIVGLQSDRQRQDGGGRPALLPRCRVVLGFHQSRLELSDTPRSPGDREAGRGLIGKSIDSLSSVTRGRRRLPTRSIPRATTNAHIRRPRAQPNHHGPEGEGTSLRRTAVTPSEAQMGTSMIEGATPPPKPAALARCRRTASACPPCSIGRSGDSLHGRTAPDRRERLLGLLSLRDALRGCVLQMRQGPARLLKRRSRNARSWAFVASDNARR